MKTTLTIEESARLIELGVDPKFASGERFFVSDDDRTEYFDKIERLTGKRDLPKGVFQKREKPYVNGRTSWPLYHKIFTLTDILSILPKEIYSEERDLSYFLTMVMPPHKCQAYYHRYSPKGFGPIMKAPELIDALYQLLIWCLEQGFINSNTNKK